MKFRILVVDDDVNVKKGIEEFLQDEGYETYSAANGKEAMKILQEVDLDAIVSDLRMAPISGEQLLEYVVSKYPSVPVIILTGHGTIDHATKAMHKGAYDFLVKPTDFNRLLLLLKRALRIRELAVRNREFQEELDKHSSDIKMLTKSKAMQKVQEVVQQVAPTNATVLLTGESGVGKEVVCDLMHRLSKRTANPLIKVHCAALSESLLESELFGHEKGSFTGALAQRKGRFELADGGTIFLDEIGEIDANTQVKLLRVLQERKFERVGGEKTIQVDVRVIVATNKNLREEVDKGNFREDLFYRLSVVNLEIPPLRERKEDVVLLAQSFLKTISEENNKKMAGFDKAAMQALTRYDWPGNIRELRNCIENAVVMAQGKLLAVDDLPEVLRTNSDSNDVEIALGMSLADVEKKYIQAMLITYKGNKSKVADILKIGRKTLYAKIENYGIK